MCDYCIDDTKDIFFEEFNGVEISVFINDRQELELYISDQGEELKKTVLIKFCPFCGRKLREESKKYKLTRYVHEWDDPIELGEFDSIEEAKEAGQADMEKVFCGRWFTTMEKWKEMSYGFKNEALRGDDNFTYVIAEEG